MRFFSSRLLLWGVYSLIIPQISSIPIPQDLQFPKVDDGNTLVSQNYFLDESPHEHSLDIRDSPRPPESDCGYQRGNEVPSGVKGEKKYVLYEDGETFASVRLRRRLGGGSQGSVWKGELKYYRTHENERNGLPILHPEKVAVKISPGGKGIDKGLLQDEIESDNIMRFKELVWSQNTMESIQVMPRGHGDLSEALRKGKRINVASSIRSIGQALLAAHQQNIVHRDIKPDNVLFGGGRGEKTYLIDWDLAIKVPEKYTTRRGGQKNYQGPEAANGEEFEAFKNDVFALALTWLEAELPKDMQNRDFRRRLYEWLTVAGNKRTKPGRSYDDTSEHLKKKFGGALSKSKRHLIAHGLCFQSARFSLSEFMSKFDSVN